MTRRQSRLVAARRAQHPVELLGASTATYGPELANTDDRILTHTFQNDEPFNIYNYHFVSSALGADTALTASLALSGDPAGEVDGVWTRNAYIVAFDDVPDMASIVSATLRLRCTAQTISGLAAIQAQVTPQPAVMVSGGDNMFDLGEFTSTDDYEHTFTANQTDTLDITDMITELIATPEWIAVSKPARLQFHICSDDIFVYSCTLASANNATEAYKPQLTIVYVPA